MWPAPGISIDSITAVTGFGFGRVVRKKESPRLMGGGPIEVVATDVAVGPPPISVNEGFFLTLRPRTNPVTAVMLSMLIPGAGHIYSGRPGAGVAWMATTLMGYACCFLPGLFLHGLCLVSAAQTRRA